MNYDLTNQLAVVTGASSGIGRSIANTFHQAGANVVITGRHYESLSRAAISIGERCTPIICDHSDPSSISSMAQQVLEEFGGPDILVNNAGCMKSRPVIDMPLELWNQVLQTNLTGVFITTQAFLPAMIEKNRGDILMISSMSGKKGDKGASAYAASKFGLQGFSQALMHEVRQHNIRVMVMNPSSVDKSSNPAKKFGAGLNLHADDLAATALHLVCLPGRTTIRDMDIWGTNPF